MHSLSVWASRHRWTARCLIVLGFTLLTELAFFTGALLQELHVALPLVFFYGALVLFFATFLLYPDHHLRSPQKNRYPHQKAFDKTLIAATFVMLLFVGNRPEPVLQLAVLPATASTPPTEFKPDTKTIQPAKLSKRALKHALLKKVRAIRHAYKELGTGGKIAFVILSLLVAFALFYLLAALSCSISCSGSEGLALVVLLLGTAIILFFLIRIIRRIFKGPRVPRHAPAPSGT